MSDTSLTQVFGPEDARQLAARAAEHRVPPDERTKPDATRFVRCGVRLDEIVCLDDKVKVKRVVVPCVEVDITGDIIEAVAR